jgi:Uma2 family endonuclease
MAEIVMQEDMIVAPDISHIITEDDQPVDNIFSEKQQRLLAESLNSAWRPDTPFVAFSNVGIFYALYKPPIVPDMFLSLNVELPPDIWKKEHRSYFIWEYGKPPEVVVEIVSNTKGRENSRKIEIYSQIGVWYYVVFDPQHLIQKESLRIFQFSTGNLIPKIDRELTNVGLSLTVWEGAYEGRHDHWLRWLDADGNLILTGHEHARQEKQRAEQEKIRAEQEKQRADQENTRAEQEKQRADQAEKKAASLAAALKKLGMDPDALEAS